MLPGFGVENPYDKLTDNEGKAGFTFEEPGYHLLVVHLEVEEQTTGGEPSVLTTCYTGDLTVMVRPKSHMIGLFMQPREQSLKQLDPAPASL